MPTFPSNPTITSRLSTGSALTYTQMDTNFGNLTASIDSVISVSRTASYVDSSNVYYTGTSQSFWSASISSSTVGTATIAGALDAITNEIDTLKDSMTSCNGTNSTSKNSTSSLNDKNQNISSDWSI